MIIRFFKKNYEDGGIKEGYLMRDHVSWYRSNQKLRRLQRDTNARVVFGHDPRVVDELLNENSHFE